ncbi:MAG: hypothetical protein JKY03_01910 [Aureispira sp.]|nr:hypothetical protein [Aureispira sp.]
MPKETGQLTKLERLILNYNILNHISNEIGDLKSMIELSLFGSGLDEFPTYILNSPNLEILSLIDNHILSLPKI